MTTLPRPTWKCIACDPPPRGWWHTLASGPEGDALATFKHNLADYSPGGIKEAGGLRLLNQDGKPVRFAGKLGRETS